MDIVKKSANYSGNAVGQIISFQKKREYHNRRLLRYIAAILRLRLKRYKIYATASV